VSLGLELNIHTMLWFGGTTGGLTGLEWTLNLTEVATLPELLPIVDLGLAGHDIYEFWDHYKIARKKLRKLRESCP
jgi:hypothetical protein